MEMTYILIFNMCPFFLIFLTGYISSKNTDEGVECSGVWPLSFTDQSILCSLLEPCRSGDLVTHPAEEEPASAPSLILFHVWRCAEA